ncbi:MAG TPA: class I SAM-dependent methyltransferase [Chlamydiales bacterium]|nr:class I SAM-dependent methyltransferase [Chlamydiales bacterium]
MFKDTLESVYRDHHEKKARYGYLYCHGERGIYLKNWIGVGKKVLDLGCRDGMLTSYFAKGNEVLGVDVDRNALALAQKRLNIETNWTDLNTEWPFPPHSFDVIVACEIMEHLFFLEVFLDKVKETLKPGGLFLGSVPNSFRMRNRLKFLFGYPYENDPTHVRQFSGLSLQKHLLKHFQNIEIVPLQGKILPLIPVSPKMPHSINQLFAKDLLWKSTLRG